MCFRSSGGSPVAPQASHEHEPPSTLPTLSGGRDLLLSCLTAFLLQAVFVPPLVSLRAGVQATSASLSSFAWLALFAATFARVLTVVSSLHRLICPQICPQSRLALALWATLALRELAAQRDDSFLALPARSPHPCCSLL